jgi:hypothetical protein
LEPSLQKQTDSKRYIFQGDAIGASGQINHPFHDILSVQAASALTADGGFSTARVDGFRYKEIFSFASAYTQITGSEPHPGVFETLSLSVVEKLNILGVVTCDRVVARVTTKYPGDRGAGTSPPPETSIVPRGSYFERLRIGNEFFESVEIADYLCQPEYACWSGLLKALESNEKRTLLQPLSLPAPGPNGKPAPLLYGGKAPGLLGFSVALRAPKNPDELGDPLRFEVPHFGTVHLGEFFCYPDSRQLTMLRVELGCPVGGLVIAARGSGGGTPYPPLR